MYDISALAEAVSAHRCETRQALSQALSNTRLKLNEGVLSLPVRNWPWASSPATPCELQQKGRRP